jgi:uncharacterized protein YecE (DUF72 family)
MNLYVGTSGYSYKEWKDKFYPKDLPAAQMLRYYGERFRAVEINSTFFAMPKPAVLEQWASAVPADFRFVLKAPKRITHVKALQDKGELLEYLFNAAGTLQQHLGPMLFQLPPTLKKDAARLRAFLESLPGQQRITIEFRHQSWFDDEVYELLRAQRVALCIADAEDDLEIPFVATTDWGYLRLRRPDYVDAALKKWVKQIKDQAWREAYVFFRHEDEANGPRLAQRLIDLAG